jgi:L-asparaginase II
MTDPHGYVPLAAVERNGFGEGLHFGRLVALDVDGSELFSYGDVDAPVHPRSANKLMQASGMRSTGLRLDDGLLALSAASHWGEPCHVEGVRAILGSAGLDESALQTTPSLPEDADARRVVVCGDNTKRPILHGCSGKHAAMLATCVANDWPVDGYPNPDHPLQRAIADTVADLTGETVAATGVDGCGAPVMAVSTTGLARAFGALAAAPPGTAERRVADAMRARPFLVGGTSSQTTTVMELVPGLLAKEGADGIFAAALPSGAALALKIADGSSRARAVVLVAWLRLLDPALPGDGAALDAFGAAPVWGGGRRVGAVEPAVPVRIPAERPASA